MTKGDVDAAVSLLERVISELPPEKRDTLDTVRQHILVSFAQREADYGVAVGDGPRDLDVTLEMGSFLQFLHQKIAQTSEESNKQTKTSEEL